MTKLSECAMAVVPHICRATQDYDSKQDAIDFRRGTEIARAVIRCLMEVDDKMNSAGGSIGDYPWDGLKPTRIFNAMLQSVLDEGK